MADILTRLGVHDSRVVLEPQVLTPGTHVFRLNCTGNALLSTVWVKSLQAGASVVINYWDFGPGGGSYPGERIPLGSHIPISTADTSHRKIISKLHDKIRMDVVVSGGWVELGVYTTVIAFTDFPAPHIDGNPVDLPVDGGIPIAVYDEVQGKFFLLRGINGALAVDADSMPGKVLSASGTLAAPPATTDLVTDVVPAGKTWRVKYGSVACRGWGRWSLLVNGADVGGGVTGPEDSHSREPLSPWVVATAGQTVKITHTYSHGPVGMDFDARIGVVEI